MPITETPKSLLITGATGFLGHELVRHLLITQPGAHLTLAIRGRDEADARARGDKLLTACLPAEALPGARGRVRVVRADLTKPLLGLSQRDRDQLVAETGAVIHGAASVSFSLPLDEARAINVDGTRQVLDLAKKAGARTTYVGTAYVAGERHGLVREAELDVGQSFRNTYEQTKMWAEKLVRERAADQPATILRPSIIVGDSTSGRTASFKVLYWPLKIFSHGFARVVPGRRDTPVDVVPSDFVVRAIAHLHDDPRSLGKTYHLTAGPEGSATVGQLAELAADFFRVRQPLFVNPELFIRYARPLIDRFAFGRLRQVLITGRVYTPYLSLDMSFDTTEARGALGPAGLTVPRVEDYFARLLRYCLDTDWGKRPQAAAA